MLGKKGEDKKPSKEDELIKRVDAMMDPKITETPKSAPEIDKNVESSPQPELPPIDIFKETKTAPEIPGKPAKKDAPETKPPEKLVQEPKDTNEKADDTTSEIAEPAEQLPQEPVNDLGTPLDDSETDKAVEDIVAKEGDALLAVEDAAVKKINNKTKEKPGFKTKLKRILKSKTTWAIVAAMLIVLFAVPQTRYAILGLVIKKQVTVEVTDSKTKTPVSSAHIRVNGQDIKTDAEGKASLQLGVGPRTLEISKEYYETSEQSLFVGLKGQTTDMIKLKASGRQVPIVVVNSITNKPIANAEIQILKTSATTDKKGKATIVLPAGKDTETAAVRAKGYNPTTAAIRVTNAIVKQNTIAITPAGQVYFLSNQSGKIDVVKANLDGSDRKTVLTGTGREEGNNTSLLASRDWRYVVLKSRRDNAQPALYVIDTRTDKVTQFDNSNASFDLIGWYGHDFVYSAQNNTIPQSQSGKQIIKSYDADKGHLNQLDQTKAEGTPSTYGYQTFDNFSMLNNLLLYTVVWTSYDLTGNGFSLANKQAAIRGIQPDGQAKKDYQTFPATNVGYVQSALHAPQSVYYAVHNASNGQISYYQFENNAVEPIKGIDQTDLRRVYPTYLISPAGNRTLWSDLRDGKNNLFTGDMHGKNATQIASNGEYTPYGWYSDELILVSKNNSQLYVMPVSGLAEDEQPLKVTDYYRPSTTLSGYGYGYGGL